MSLSLYLDDLHQQVQLHASVPDRERSWAAAFTEVVLEHLAGIGEIQDAVAAQYDQSHLRPAAAASGFAIRGDNEVLDVFLSVYDGGMQVTTLRKAEVDAAFRRMHSFLTRCGDGLHMDLEESSDAYDMAQRIQALMKEVAFVRLFLLTDTAVKVQPAELPPVHGLPVAPMVWDLERLQRLSTSGREREPIVVDMLAFNGDPLPFLGPEGDPDDYQGYLLLIPGEVLADIYAEFGPRLLELNVRSFLQGRGKVNRGMQDTIKNSPERFLAYNNGVSMTASRVETGNDDSGRVGITAIHDLQIVNGGQTTASLFHALTKGKLPLTDVRVQAKLSVVRPDRLPEVVPLISQFANSQNAVKSADFSANHPFHVRLEELSRSVWAPAVGGGPLMTHWFYERARGQYMDALSRAGSPANQRQFKQRNPLAQKFVKTDVAKFENTWAQLPHTVALGADKNFSAYMLRVDGGGSPLPGRTHFEELVAKALLFRTTEKLIGDLKLGGYRSQTVTYTLALLSARVGTAVDLGDIWRQQEIPAGIVDVIRDLAPSVHSQIVHSAGSSNVSEFAKRQSCWEAVQRLSVDAGPHIGRVRIGRASVNFTATTAPGRGGPSVFIHADYDGHRMHATFDPTTKAVVLVGGPLDRMAFSTPSGAARAVVQHHRPGIDPSRNGWTFWTVTESGRLLQSLR
jgi:hypothetical protein